MKTIPEQVREAMHKVARHAKERGDHSAAHFLSGAALLLDDAEVCKLRSLLR